MLLATQYEIALIAIIAPIRNSRLLFAISNTII